MSRIDATQQSFSLAMRLERFLMAGLKRRRYAAAGFVFAAVLSISLLGQIRYAAEQPGRLIFTAEHTLVQPAGYREWIFAGSSLGPGCSANDWTEAYHNVYVSPAAYREYAHSGRFPDGTVIVKETLSVESMKDPGFRGSYEKDLIGLKVSVKDSSRFGDGWGFYDFTEPTGDTRSETQLLPQTAGCISCHRDRGATDHVFTQFYPVLRGIGS